LISVDITAHHWIPSRTTNSDGSARPEFDFWAAFAGGGSRYFNPRLNVYVETRGDRSELYDLEKDPYQLENRINGPAYAEILAEMKGRLKRLRLAGERKEKQGGTYAR